MSLVGEGVVGGGEGEAEAGEGDGGWCGRKYIFFVSQTHKMEGGREGKAIG